MAGALIGTPSFMSPEQFDPGGEFGEVGPKTDIWGLGATLFFVLTGEPPFAAKNVVDLYTAVTGQVVRRPRSLRADVPEELEDILMACLVKKTEDRLDAEGLISRLLALKGGLAREGSRRGVKHASVVVLVFVVLVILELTVLEPQRGKALLRQLGLSQGATSEAAPAEIQGLLDLIEAGDASAMIKLAVRYHKGNGVETSNAEALALFQRAVDEQSSAPGMMWLGYMHENGHGLEGGEDLERALHWYKQAAQHGKGTVKANSKRKIKALEKLLGGSE